MGGQNIDAAVVPTPKQRSIGQEKAVIKDGPNTRARYAFGECRGSGSWALVLNWTRVSREKVGELALRDIGDAARTWAS